MEKKDIKNINGISLSICIGSWGGVYAYKGESTLRLCLGWMAITLYLYDLENVIAKILKG